GLAPGDRVAVIAEKSPALLWLHLGCLRAGLVYQPLNPGYSEREIAFFLDNAAARLVIADPTLAARIVSAIAGLAASPRVLSLDADGRGEFTALCTDAGHDFATHENRGDDVAALLYSSGTTGTPKGIPLTHDNLHHNACALHAAWAFTRADVLLHALP